VTCQYSVVSAEVRYERRKVSGNSGIHDIFHIFSDTGYTRVVEEQRDVNPDTPFSETKMGMQFFSH